MADRSYKAIFFDLDGTLLPMEVEHFLREYFNTLGRCAKRHGYDHERMCECVAASVNSMAHHEPECLNSLVFWSHFEELWGELNPELEAFFDDFYANEYNDIALGHKPNPFAAQAVNELREKGYRLYLTTMPLFPRLGVENRLRWAGVDPQVFEHITCYDNSTAVKPSLDYYRENIKRIGLDPHDILMVGNNALEDMVALELGLDGYLVTDCLINPNDFDINQVKHGSLADFADFVRALPRCEAGKEL